MGLKIYFNGEFVEQENAKVSVFDHGLLYGDGVFEGIRSYNRRVFRLQDHMDRLYNGAKETRLEIPLTKKEFEKAILETLKINNLDDSYIRAVVTRGPGDLGLDPRKCNKATVFIIAGKIKLYPAEFYEKGLPIIIAKTRRIHPTAINPRIKSLNYLNNILAKIEAIDAGTDEALMLTNDGFVAECTGDNIYSVKNGVIYTPPCEIGALEGVTQKVVIELAEARKIKVKRVKMKPKDFFKTDECFLTGTAAEIIPVTKVDGKKIGKGVPGKITLELREDFRALTQKVGVGY
ncbi:MAG TPA: branched-chain-amino-acid transaminase [Candidatus Omnitrophota bacterium]|nr:branched-chain-amino-acid transaminase [Candidatus Omnitrophota bacterium]HPS20416.1 branched-chain-amino-acid transaminase [Candidatus Omnitrophota bacterium]